MPCEQLSVTRECQGAGEAREGKKVGGSEGESEGGERMCQRGEPGGVLGKTVQEGKEGAVDSREQAGDGYSTQAHGA